MQATSCPDYNMIISKASTLLDVAKNTYLTLVVSSIKGCTYRSPGAFVLSVCKM